MSTDITNLLNDWPYDSDNNTRLVTAKNGRRVLQVRQPLGIEQYELDGRPDGLRPAGYETAVESVERRLSEHIDSYGNDEAFELSHDECATIRNEGILYYYRYLVLFQMNDFARVVRDTNHNLRICELLEEYCDDEDDRNAVLQHKPYVFRMHAVATAMNDVKNHRPSRARTVIQNAIAEIQAMEEIEVPAFQFERVRSINYLKSALEQIQGPDSDPVAVLSAELESAVADEDYERAAELRDRIRDLS